MALLVASSKHLSFHLQLFVLSCSLFVTLIQGDTTYECPKAYLDNDQSCYLFVIQPQLTFQEGEIACRRQNAVLLSVKSAAEHKFIVDWLTRTDVDRHNWLTSGVRRGGSFEWTSDGSTISNFHFSSDNVKNELRVDQANDIEYRQIIYKYNKTLNSYVWEWGRLMDPMSYICQIPKVDLWKAYQQDRDFAFGTGIEDPLKWPQAPNITDQSGNIVFFKKDRFQMTPVDINCLATGNPQPSYTWYRQTVGGSPVNINGDQHYSITNGRLYIQSPREDKDVGEYHCQATNEHGTVLSDPIRVSYGKLDEFPNVKTGDYNAKLYMGVEIDCQAPTYKPEARFNWFKGSILKFIRPSLNPQMFLSQNGKLYISEVAASDAGEYFCAVYLAPRPGEKLASGQALSRNSLPITLRVNGDNPNTYGPDIQDKFPQVFPKSPMVGQTMTLECLAYGRLPLEYSWVREDAPMNPKAYTTDRDRVLIIPSTRLQDSGTYTCIVKGVKSTKNSTRVINLSGAPSFPIPLTNQFLDANSPFTWSCLPQGIPVPTVTWLKDGKKLKASDPDLDITVRGRHIFFRKVTVKNNGVYTCEAENALGIRRNSAQLRAISFKPTFARRPVLSSLRATSGGSITIKCLPEAAPRPDIAWTKNGGGLPGGAVVHPNGALELKDLSVSDSGTYICQATNSLGSAESSGVLSVSDTTVLTERPISSNVAVNGSTSLRCKASFNALTNDVMYEWRFYEHVIDLTEDISYSMPYMDKGSGDLYLISAQYVHEGIYTCLVSTVTDSIQESAYLTVQGPPEEPAGVHRHKNSVHNGPTSVDLWWTVGKVHGNPITSYLIQVKTDEQSDDQWVDLLSITEEDAKIQDVNFDKIRRAVVSNGLSPGTSYCFRVKAGSVGVGYSKPSLPSTCYKMKDAAPVFPPTEVGGGGGKEQQLRITWKPLPESQWGTNHIRYIVYYKKKGNTEWLKTTQISEAEYHHTFASPYDLFYWPYEVKVQAVNDLGSGPNSTTVIVMSSETMPDEVPVITSANAINSTAGTVEWKYVNTSREALKGSIYAFQVNYWEENTLCRGDNEKNLKFIRAYGNVTSVDVIGLSPGGDNCVNVQFLNHAGLGPKTANYPLGMNDPAPGSYPEYVIVSSHGPESVRVRWRGVNNNFPEAPIVGYKGWYWKMGEDIRSAKEVTFGQSMTGVIHGIEDTGIYKLRVFAYSSGGLGKKAPDVIFTLANQAMFNVETMEVLNSSHRTKASTLLPISMAVIYRILFV